MSNPVRKMHRIIPDCIKSLWFSFGSGSFSGLVLLPLPGSPFLGGYILDIHSRSWSESSVTWGSSISSTKNSFWK